MESLRVTLSTSEINCFCFSPFLFVQDRISVISPTIVINTIFLSIIPVCYLLHIRVCGADVLMASTMASPTSARLASR